MSAAEELRARLASWGVASAEGLREGPGGLHAPATLSTGVPELDALLPGGGFPVGVVELSAPHGVGGATWLRARALAALHARSPHALGAWVEPVAGPFLHAPALAQLGVDLARLLVVRVAAPALDRVAQRIVTSACFGIVCVDAPRVDTAREASARERSVRRLALATETAGSAVLVATDAYAPCAAPLPVALRLELTRLPESVSVRVGRARGLRGAVADGRTVTLRDVAA